MRVTVFSHNDLYTLQGQESFVAVVFEDWRGVTDEMLVKVVSAVSRHRLAFHFAQYAQDAELFTFKFLRLFQLKLCRGLL